MNPDQIKQIIQDKVQGIWIADHDERGHFYKNTKTGTRVASITTKQKIIDKPHLKAWSTKKGIEWLEIGDRWERLKGPERNLMMVGAQNAHMDETGVASDIGVTAHAVIENYLKYWIEKGVSPTDIRKGFLQDANPRAIAAARAAERIFKENNIIPLATEMLVGSEKLNSAGTLDFLCLWDGQLTLGDFKTTNSIDDGYACQVAAYKFMFEEMSGLKIKQVKILQLSKDMDKFHKYRIPRIASAYRALKGISTYYDWVMNDKVKVEKDVKRLVL